MKFFYFLMLSWLSVASSSVEYSESGFSISSARAGVAFYHESTPNSFTPYAAALVYGKEDRLGELSLTSRDSFFYSCTHNEENYKGLSERFSEIKECLSSIEPIISEPDPCEPSSLPALVAKIQESDNVYITFGAGISHGYVPTLLDVFRALDLEKVTSNDKATDRSFISFVNRLFGDERERILKTIREEWGQKVMRCSVDSTPAHQATKELVEHLTGQGKIVRVYTDNIDGIHEKLNIPLSEQKQEGGSTILYPPIEEIGDKKSVVLGCGQSFDFHGVLSTIYARQNSPEKISFFSLNVDPRSIVIYKGLDVDTLNPHEGVDLSDFETQSLPMYLVQGSLHDTLPVLYDCLKASTLP